MPQPAQNPTASAATAATAAAAAAFQAGASSLYAVLGLPAPSAHKAPTQDEIRAACRAALLLHHPDKAATARLVDGRPNSTLGAQAAPAPAHPSRAYPVEVVYQARRILTDVVLRAEYDRQLRLQGEQSDLDGSDAATRAGAGAAAVSATGMEVVDLDDLTWHADEGVWTRGCRCGNWRGFEVREAELEAAMEGASGVDGEVVVGCRDCSLGMRVVFAMAHDDEAGEGGKEEEFWHCGDDESGIKNTVTDRSF